jgi:hypothetical protein
VSHPGKPLVPGPPEGFWNSSRAAPEEPESTSGPAPEALPKPSALIGSDLIRSDLIRSDPPYPPGGEPAAAAVETSVPEPDRKRQALTPRPPMRVERIRTEWSGMSIQELARRCRENPHDAAISGPENRPEVLQVQRAWCEAVGLPIRELGSLSEKNQALKSILTALETNSFTDVLRACAQARTDDWAQGRVANRDGTPGKKCRLEWMSLNVIRRLLDAADAARPSSVNPKIAAILEAERKRELEQRA